MKRRGFLGLLVAAPIAAPVVAKALAEVEPMRPLKDQSRAPYAQLGKFGWCTVASSRSIDTENLK